MYFGLNDFYYSMKIYLTTD